MPIRILYWLLVILWFISYLTGFAVQGFHVSNGLLLILFILLGWQNFGPPLQKG